MPTTIREAIREVMTQPMATMDALLEVILDDTNWLTPPPPKKS